MNRGERALLTVPGVFVQQFLVAVNIMAFRAAPSLQALLVSALHGYACYFYLTVRPYTVAKENIVNTLLSGVLAILGVLLLAGHIAGGDDIAGSLIVYLVATSLLCLLILQTVGLARMIAQRRGRSVRDDIEHVPREEDARESVRHLRGDESEKELPPQKESEDRKDTN